MSDDGLHGTIGIGEDARGRKVYLSIRTGELTYEGEAGHEPYIQVICVAAAGASEPPTGDLFETDDLDELRDSLHAGVLPWYGETITFRVATPEERARIQATTGW
ncbi:hypothetical protein N0X72_21895 [Streptomyces carpaticus]|uniref:hypothetical protein n=1 Tax=Streptomyces TaxID=1883 RepID=UPI0021FEBDE1|nr:hypothetical protein N0X72_21895 [Streptomyces carpaticus]